MDEPTVTLKLTDYNKLRQNERDLQDRLMAAEAKLEQAQLADPAGTLKALHGAFIDAMQVTQFAVGNLPSESVAGWPHEALTRLADALDALPGIDRHLREITPELRDFARTAAGFEAWRKERDKNRVVVPASAADFGPQTDEARAVHETRSKLNSNEPTT